MWGQIIGAGIGAVGSMFGQASANSQNSQMAKDQIWAQDRFRRSAHQVEVEDLKAAGLNPILSSNAGAATPGGAMGHAENVAGGLASTAKDMAFMKQQLEKGQAEIGLIGAQKNKTNTEAALAATQLNKGETESTMWDAAKNLVQKALGSTAEQKQKFDRDQKFHERMIEKANKTPTKIGAPR